MTDVRLTALNPVDSQVYPVACNTSGELLVAQDTDPDLTVTGDLTVDGTASFNNGDVNIDSLGRLGIGSTSPAANLDVLVNSASDSEIRVRNNTDGMRLIMQADGSSLIRTVFNRGLIFGSGASNTSPTFTERMKIDSSGSITFGSGFDASSTSNQGLKIDTNGAIFNQRTSTNSTLFMGYYQNTNTVTILADGSATFAGDVTAPNINSLNALVTELETKMSLILRQIDISADTP